MIRRTVLPALIGLAVAGAVPALADANGSSEQRSVERSCSAAPDNRYSDPGPGDCRNPDGSPNPGGTYTATHWSNDVRCGTTNAVAPANPTGVRLYASQGGGVGVCSEGGAVPGLIQGRAGVSGDTANGARVVVDGDKENPNETAAGWVEVKAGPSGASYRCGDEPSQGGKADSDTPEERDTSAECGSGS